jgi:uncharacterized membrane protein
MGETHRTLRSFAILVLIAIAVTALQLVVAVYLLTWILVMVGTAFILYMLYRENRAEIGTWPTRARAVFYGAAILILVDVAAIWLLNHTGLDAVAFLAVLAAGGFAMWRTWRDQHTYV